MAFSPSSFLAWCIFAWIFPTSMKMRLFTIALVLIWHCSALAFPGRTRVFLMKIRKRNLHFLRFSSCSQPFFAMAIQSWERPLGFCFWLRFSTVSVRQFSCFFFAKGAFLPLEKSMRTIIFIFMQCIIFFCDFGLCCKSIFFRKRERLCSFAFIV